MKKNPFDTPLPPPTARRVLAESSSNELFASQNQQSITSRVYLPLALSVPEAAWELSISTPTLYRWIREGKFPQPKSYPDESSKTSRILSADLLQWLEERHSQAEKSLASRKKKGGTAGQIRPVHMLAVHASISQNAICQVSEVLSERGKND